jgi:hypothetical protein
MSTECCLHSLNLHGLDTKHKRARVSSGQRQKTRSHGTTPSLIPDDTKTKVKALPLISAASRNSLSSSSVGTLSRAYRLIIGSMRFIFFQFITTLFISRNNLTALSQLFTVPAVISPLSIFNLSCDRRERDDFLFCC